MGILSVKSPHEHRAGADDPVNIRYDNVFKAVFARNIPESRTAFSRLVSAIAGRNLTALSIAANELPANSLGGSADPLRHPL
jgi:hypothetical protein